jgi:hypothetical protein
MPLLAPVTNARFPFSLKSIGILLDAQYMTVPR